MENNCLYVTWFCLLWTVTVGIYRSFVCRGQYWLVYHPFLSAVAVDNDDRYVTWFCLSWTILVGIFHGCVWLEQYWLVYQPVLSVMDSNGWYISLFCLTRTIFIWHISLCCISRTKMVGISPGLVCYGQKWLVYLLFFSVVDKIGWYINRICLSWTIMDGISAGFVCHGQYWLVYHPVFVCR